MINIRTIFTEIPVTFDLVFIFMSAIRRSLRSEDDKIIVDSHGEIRGRGLYVNASISCVRPANAFASLIRM